jgi:hypothetical protein
MGKDDFQQLRILRFMIINFKKSIDIFSAYDAFLEYLSSDTLKANMLSSRCIDTVILIKAYKSHLHLPLKVVIGMMQVISIRWNDV